MDKEAAYKKLLELKDEAIEVPFEETMKNIPEPLKSMILSTEDPIKSLKETIDRIIEIEIKKWM